MITLHITLTLSRILTAEIFSLVTFHTCFVIPHLFAMSCLLPFKPNSCFLGPYCHLHVTLPMSLFHSYFEPIFKLSFLSQFLTDLSET